MTEWDAKRGCDRMERESDVTEGGMNGTEHLMRKSFLPLPHRHTGHLSNKQLAKALSIASKYCFHVIFLPCRVRTWVHPRATCFARMHETDSAQNLPYLECEKVNVTQDAPDSERHKRYEKHKWSTLSGNAKHVTLSAITNKLKCSGFICLLI